MILQNGSNVYGTVLDATKAFDIIDFCNLFREIIKRKISPLDEDGGKNMIFKMARDRTEDGRDTKRGAVIQDTNGRLITESKEVLMIWPENFKELLNEKGAASCLEVEVEEIRQEEVETAMHKMKKGKATGQMKCG